MNLWIRSQDGSALIKVYNLQLDSFNVKKDKVLIINSRTYEECAYLGEYNTEERALEVLDEIHKLVEDLLNYDHLEYKVYSMPKE